MRAFFMRDKQSIRHADRCTRQKKDSIAKICEGFRTEAGLKTMKLKASADGWNAIPAAPWVYINR